MPRIRTLLLVSTLTLAPAARAQEPSIEDHDLPRRVEARLRALLDDSATRRFNGPTRIEAGRIVRGNITAFGGPFTLAGAVTGDLVVVDGDAVFEPGAEVEGDVTVVAGTARGVDSAEIAGSLTVYGEGFGAADRDGATAGRRDGDWAWWDGDDGRPVADRRITESGYSRIVVRPGGAYNRVEGLPIRVGPVVQTDGSNPLRLTALGVVRTENGGELDRDDIGYSLRAEQFLGGRGELSVGLGAHSVVEPIDAWSLRDLEAGLSTFVLHTDPRDYYDRTGWTAFTRYTPRGLPLDATVEFRSDDYGLAAVNDPYTLFGDDPWRLQPLAATGTLRSIAGRIVIDARDDDDFPTRGWYMGATALRGLDGSIDVPAFAGPDRVLPDDVIPVTPAQRFEAAGITHLFLEARRYQRTGHDGVLAFRVVAGGTPTDQPLPPQLQHALGGAGTAPGFDRLALDCGARRVQVTRVDGGTFYPFYGCDRFALFQAEYIGRIDIDFDFDRDDDFDDGDDWWDGAWDGDIDLDLSWVAFFDAAQGWTLRETLRETAGAIEVDDTGMNYDIGAGLLFGDFGIYGALPLTGPDDDARIILRLGRRF